jgi:hypothetical protein
MKRRAHLGLQGTRLLALKERGILKDLAKDTGGLP